MEITNTIPHSIQQWLDARGWEPFPFQRETWSAYLAGRSGLIHAPTGMGKSYAAWLGPLLEWIDEHPAPETWREMETEPLRVLWITPLRALASDTANTLRAPVEALGLPWSVELRTGDTSSYVKQRQRRQPPTALITTPESLTLLLSYSDAERPFRHLRCVVVDEWHELLGSKRGTQTELALARLRRWHPELRTWGLSATLGNLDEALDALMGAGGGEPGTGAQRAVDDEAWRIEIDQQSADGTVQSPVSNHPAPLLIAGDVQKEIAVETLIPENMERFPWAGHLGTKLLPQVVARVQQAQSTLIFTNTRAQTERWFQALIDYTVEHAPELIGEIGLHHGSLDPALRREVETRLRDGRLRCVVSTSSLDLGVDFAPVDQVIQVGSPKGVARLMQRAGRSGHQPGAVSRVLGVPTHAFELIEFAAARDAIDRRDIEARRPLRKPLDVLVQHLVTMALGGGFESATLQAEVRTTHAYRHLTDTEWQWALDFVTFGGDALQAYAQYAKVQVNDGRHHVPSRQVAQRHRMSIGTITSDGMLRVKYQKGSYLGSIEEAFVARLKPGDRFVFAGRTLELVRVKDMTAYVRRAKKSSGVVPRWHGGRMPLSSELADAVRLRLAAADLGIFDTNEMQAVQPLLEIQSRWSRIPVAGELLIERTQTREGDHHFLYPLAGRLVHDGLATLLAYRISQLAPRTISAFATDYGCELLSAEPLDLDAAQWRQVLRTEHLLDDVLACLNSTELARRQFRDIARVAGLIFSGYPGSQKTTRQIQTSSGVLFDTLVTYDPENLLLDQARREVLEQQLDMQRLRATLETIAQSDLVITTPKRMTPLAFPIWTSRLRTEVSSETWEDRVRRMMNQLERLAGPDAPNA